MTITLTLRLSAANKIALVDLPCSKINYSNWVQLTDCNVFCNWYLNDWMIQSVPAPGLFVIL